MSFFRANQPVVLGPGEGTHLDVLGDLITLLVSGNQTNGAFTVLSQTSPPGGGTPLHTHHNEDEALYVLQGEYEIQCGLQLVPITAVELECAAARAGGLVSKRPSPFRMKDSAIRAGGREEGIPPNARQNGQTPAAGCR